MNAEDGSDSGREGTQRIDRVSVILALVTVLIVGATAWTRYGTVRRAEPPAMGSLAPPLRLIDLETSEPRLLVGHKGRVSWVVFWSASSLSGRASLARIEKVWSRFKADRRVILITAADDPEHPERVRAALARCAASASLPCQPGNAPSVRRRVGGSPASSPHQRGWADRRARSRGHTGDDRPPGQSGRWLAGRVRTTRQYAVRLDTLERLVSVLVRG